MGHGKPRCQEGYCIHNHRTPPPLSSGRPASCIIKKTDIPAVSAGKRRAIPVITRSLIELVFSAASMERWKGQAAKRQSYFSAAGQLVQGGGNYLSMSKGLGGYSGSPV